MLLHSSNLTAGMILLEDLILDSKNCVSLPAGHALTKRDIVRIEERGIPEVNIKIDDKYNTFNSSFNTLVLETLTSNDFEKMTRLASIYEEIIKSTEVLQYDIGSYLNMENYNHLVNTINIAVIVTKKYNELSEKEKNIPIKDIALASLMQDIGRSAKDPYILSRLSNKYESVIDDLILEYPNVNKEIFTNYDSKYHPVYSYLISLNYDINESVRKAILLHHEKESGENSLLGKPLSTFEESALYIDMAKILKLADLYDILIAKNVNDSPNLPFSEVGKQIDKMVSSGFVNAKLTNILKTMIPLYQVGMKVLLSDGTIGLVEENDANNYSNPIITDLKGKYIDLDKEDIKIVKHYYD